MDDEQRDRIDNTESVQAALHRAWLQMTMRLQLLELEQQRSALDLEIQFQRAVICAYEEDAAEGALEAAHAERYKEQLESCSARANAARQERMRGVTSEFEAEARAILDAVDEDTVHPALLDHARSVVQSMSGNGSAPKAASKES